MTTINPKKLLNSKWSAVSPVNKEKHFLVTEVEFGEDGEVIHCAIEAVMTKRVTAVDWRTLKDTTVWRQGWV